MGQIDLARTVWPEGLYGQWEKITYFNLVKECRHNLNDKIESFFQTRVEVLKSQEIDTC